MAMVIILPWLQLNEPIRLGDLDFLQFRRGLLPFGQGAPDQETLDKMMRPYLSTARPIESATFIRLNSQGPFDDLDDDARAKVFAAVELTTLAGLAARELFGTGLFYCNSDSFTCVIQGFDTAHAGAAITSRRRDGQKMNFISGKAYRIIQPHHVGGAMRARIDIPFLRALLSAQNQPWWEQSFEAIFSFNRANTDNESILLQSEAVQMIGAFERLFGLSSGDEKALRKALCDHFVPAKELPRNSCERVAAQRFENCTSVREAWITDFFRLRGDHSHGRRKAKYPSAWSLKEHLLLGSFLFPLLVKLLLTKEGFYAFSHKDRVHLQAFERLASARLFDKSGDDSRTPDIALAVSVENPAA